MKIGPKSNDFRLTMHKTAVAVRYYRTQKIKCPL